MNQSWVDAHRDRLRTLRQRATDAIRQMGDDDLNWRPNDDSNSVANLIVHMAGNLHQRLEAGIAGATDKRDRDAEFNGRERLTGAEILRVLHESFDMADRVLSELTPDRLMDSVSFRSQQVPILQVLVNVTTHMAEHVGQILYIAKLRLGPAYQTLSTPHRRG